jgi:hypothetical protein
VIIDIKEWETKIIPAMTRITLLNGEGRMQAFEFLLIEDEMTTKWQFDWDTYSGRLIIIRGFFQKNGGYASIFSSFHDVTVSYQGLELDLDDEEPSDGQ